MDEEAGQQDADSSYPKLLKSIYFKNCSIMKNNILFLNNIHLNLKLGDSIAITGSNGSGKTSIIKLFINRGISKGRLLINGKPVKYASNLSKLIAYQPETSIIFDGTLAENLFVKDLNEATRVAKLYGIYDQLKKYFDSEREIDSEIMELEDQRLIAFLRCIIMKNRPIILLDNPIMNLIPRILELNSDKILIITTLSSNKEILKRFDKVYHLDNHLVERFDLVR